MTRFLGLVLLLSPAPVLASPADLCDAAAEQAAAENGVPLALMRAVTRVETGRDNAPWPWTLNVGGQGQWFDTAEDAVAAAEQAVAEGLGQVDLLPEIPQRLGEGFDLVGLTCRLQGAAVGVAGGGLVGGHMLSGLGDQAVNRLTTQVVAGIVQESGNQGLRG